MSVFRNYAPYRFRGLAVTEFAIVLPLLLLLMFATAELGRWMYQYNALAKAVRDGVRYLSSHSYSPTGTITGDAWENTKNVILYGAPEASDAMEPLLPGLTGEHIEIGYTEGHLRIAVSDYAYKPMVFAAIPGFGLWNDIPLTVLRMPVSVSFVPLE
jgi:hypothetical protein